MQVDSHSKWLNDVVAHCENGVSFSAFCSAVLPYCSLITTCMAQWHVQPAVSEFPSELVLIAMSRSPLTSPLLLTPRARLLSSAPLPHDIFYCCSHLSQQTLDAVVLLWEMNVWADFWSPPNFQLFPGAAILGARCAEELEVGHESCMLIHCLSHGRLCCRYGMLDPSLKDKEGLPLTIRAVFIVGKPQVR